MRFLANPGDEPLYFRVGSQSVKRIVIALKLLIVKDNVYVPVARRAEADREVNLLTVKSLFVSLVLMTRPGNEVVPGQPLHLPGTELAVSFPCATFRLAHLPNANTPLPVLSEPVCVRRGR